MEQRVITYECLKAVMIDKQYSNLVLRRILKTVETQKRPKITRVVYGTLENFRYVRWQWEAFVSRLPKPEICVLLDMAVYELLWMNEKPYALLNESVELAKRYVPSAAKMVNALLRRVNEQGMRPLPADPEEALALETSHPLWLYRMWKAQYGQTIAEQLCHDTRRVRKHAGRVNTCKLSRAELLAQDSHFSPSVIGDDAVIYDYGNIADTSWYQSGCLAIQDEASQMIAPLLNPQPGQRILDVCSAPGTKATHMAQLMKDQGEIIALDIHEHRTALITQGARRLGLSCIHARCMDATHLEGLEKASFDGVLCDVPCSGYGTLSRKSDIKYHMQSSDMDTLIPLQAAILRQASVMVRPGGVLVYSTCTLNKKENEKQIDAFLQEHDEFEKLTERTVFPFEYESDGFYMVKCKRK